MTPKPPPKSPPAVVEPPPERYPGVPSLALQLVEIKKGFCVCLLELEGRHIVNETLLSGPDSRTVAIERWKVFAMRYLLGPKS